MMKVLCIFLACVAVGSAAGVGRIVGGTTTNINLVPYQLGLWVSNQFKCGAAIISTKAALTSAQCVSGVTPSTITVRAGSTSRTSGTVYTVSSVTVHPSYSKTTFDYDIAVLKFTTNIVLGTNVGVATLPSVNEIASVGSAAVISGWGILTAGSTALAANLQRATVPVLATSVCTVALGSTRPITDRMLCAGYTTGGTGFCTGDTGGPLVFGGKLIGLASWGEGCGGVAKPGVYTKISSVRAWITSSAGV